MVKLTTAYFAGRLWSYVARRDDVKHYARKRGSGVYWILIRGAWVRLRWCFVTEYAPGVIRFTSALLPSPPRALWPFDAHPDAASALKVTLAQEELNEANFQRLAEVFTYPERAFDWGLLDWQYSDTNLWSDAAKRAEAKCRHRSKH